jgi:hypothetical protein
MRKLLVAVMGNRNSGKSQTWKTLFDDPNIRTSQKSLKDLKFTDEEFTKVFLINGSPQERKKAVDEIIQVDFDPAIVLCSIQYTDDAINILKHFAQNGYFIYLHWLNPGYSDDQTYTDHRKLLPQIFALNSMLGQRNGEVDETKRVEELKDYIYDWSKRNGLIRTLKTV